MRLRPHSLVALAAGGVLGLLPLTLASANDSANTSDAKTSSTSSKAVKARSKVDKSQSKAEQEVPETNLLDAVRDGLVAVDAEGRADGRMTMTITNKTRRQLRVVLPPGIIAQGATGQFGGIGGGGGGGGWRRRFGGGAGWCGGGMPGMGGMGRGAGTTPPTVGIMMLSRIIMYFCGDRESWDQRSMLIDDGDGRWHGWHGRRYGRHGRRYAFRASYKPAVY